MDPMRRSRRQRLSKAVLAVGVLLASWVWGAADAGAQTGGAIVIEGQGTTVTLRVQAGISCTPGAPVRVQVELLAPPAPVGVLAGWATCNGIPLATAVGAAPASPTAIGSGAQLPGAIGCSIPLSLVGPTTRWRVACVF